MNMMLQPITSEAEKYLKALAGTLALPPGRYRQANWLPPVASVRQGLDCWR